MRGRAKSLMIFTAAAALAATPAGAQIRTGLATQVAPVRPAATQPKSVTTPPQTAPDAPVPGNPDFTPQQVTPTTPAPAPVPLPPPVWDVVSAQGLLYYIQ